MKTVKQLERDITRLERRKKLITWVAQRRAQVLSTRRAITHRTRKHPRGVITMRIAEVLSQAPGKKLSIPGIIEQVEGVDPQAVRQILVSSSRFQNTGTRGEYKLKGKLGGTLFNNLKQLQEV